MYDNSIIEHQRSLHELDERLTTAAVQEILHHKKSKREQIHSDHRLKTLIDRAKENSGSLKALYEDKDGSRKAEIMDMSKELTEFYERLKVIKTYHKGHPGEVFIPMSIEFDTMAKVRENPDEEKETVKFTDEEGYGKYLDLHEHYSLFINIKGVERIDYLTFLSRLDRFSDIPKNYKNQAYKNYLAALLSYLNNYMARIMPLFDRNSHDEKVTAAFEKQWADGNCPGWPKEASGALAHTGAHLDLATFTSWEELASLGLDRLKSALMALGLKQGGTLQERAQRLFSCKGKDVADIHPSLFAKSKPGKTKESEAWKEVALQEAKICAMVELLEGERAATKENVQRKQARTAEERDESDGEEVLEDESDEEENDIIYNPKNVPLGWDGKPIPYWLYKLHGLNMSFECEICGKHIYKGPKEFQKHFSEWRHAHGMRCLGIPNTAHFANIVLIEDAVSLWQKLRASKDVERWKADVEEECEDSSGNVVTRKTYEDLRRQGLL